MRDTQTDESRAVTRLLVTHKHTSRAIVPEAMPSSNDFAATAALFAHHGFTLEHRTPRREPAFYRITGSKGAYSLRAWCAVLDVLASLGGRK